MPKYTCPYCGNKSFSLVLKLRTGGMTSRGTACPDCGKHAVHGWGATAADTVIMAAAFIYILVNYHTIQITFAAVLVILAFVLSRVVNALFFRLAENNRRDII